MYHSVSPSITCSALCDNQDSSNLMFYDIAQYKLMLSSDVETNPGPADLETILDAIKQSEEKVLNQIMSVKSEITDIKNDISTIHKDHLKLQSEVNEIREKQASYEEILKSTHQHVDVLEEITENLRLDIDHVNNTAETHYDTLSRLTEEVERLNIKSISNNMRVFGLSVENISTYSDLVKYVLENVLKIACPTFKWSTDDITNIRTIPSSDPKNSPLVIVTFRYEDDKYRVFNGRDLLRKNLIRVGDDLTYNQRQSLKRLKNNEGKIGYFYKGKLCVRNDNLISESSTDRVYRHARRLVTPVINSPSTDQEMDHQ
ncbi:hypothetical protein ACF0H5_019921 [Mactra antiquata]